MSGIIAFLQAHGQAIVSFLGVCLAFIVGLHPAFDNSSLVQTLAKLLGANVPPPPPSAPAA